MSLSNSPSRVNWKSRTPGHNPEHIPGRRLRDLNSQILTDRAVQLADNTGANLAWIRRIERKQTTDGFPLWLLSGEKTIHLADYEPRALDLFRAAGFDPYRMLMLEALDVEILVEWTNVPSRRGGLDARKPAVVAIVDVKRVGKSLYEQVEELMATAGYRTNSDITDSPAWVVSKAVGSIFPYLEAPAELLLKVELWLTKWKVGQPKAVESTPTIDPILIALKAAGDALDSWDIKPPQPVDMRAYFGWLVATAPVRADPSGGVKLLPSPPALIQIPAWSVSSQAAIDQWSPLFWEVRSAAPRQALRAYIPQACLHLEFNIERCAPPKDNPKPIRWERRMRI